MVLGNLLDTFHSFKSRANWHVAEMEMVIFPLVSAFGLLDQALTSYIYACLYIFVS